VAKRGGAATIELRATKGRRSFCCHGDDTSVSCMWQVPVPFPAANAPEDAATKAPFVFVWLLREFIAFSYYIQFGLLPQQWRWELVRRSPESAANCVATPLPFCHLDNNKAILNACFSCSSLFFLSFFGLEQMCRCKCISVSLHLHMLPHLSSFSPLAECQNP